MVEKIKRTERLAILSKIFADHPGKLFSLSGFAESLGCAKSSLSEDVAQLRAIYASHHLGTIETLPGAQGGVVFHPTFSDENAALLTDKLCRLINQPERILPGGYLYLTDLIGDPELMAQVGLFFAQHFREQGPEVILTVETKGIPLGMMTAQALHLPLVIIRNDSRISEGTSVGISYLSGTQKRLMTMSLPKRALARRSRVLFIDDFLRRGGTAKGILDLVSEFECECVGMGFLIDIAGEDRLVQHYISLLSLKEIDPDARRLEICRGNW